MCERAAQFLQRAFCWYWRARRGGVRKRATSFLVPSSPVFELEEPLDQLRQRAWKATTTCLRNINPLLHQAETTARAGKPDNKTKGAAPAMDIGQIKQVAEYWHLQSTSGGETVNDETTEELRHAIEHSRLFPMAPARGATFSEWKDWANKAIPQATALLATTGLRYQAGVWSGMDPVTKTHARSRQQTTTEIMDELKPDRGGGALDVLLVDFDAEGRIMPCTTQDGLVRAVKEQLIDWSSDNAYGEKAYALTWAFSTTLFDTTHDRQRLVRNQLKERTKAEKMLTRHIQNYRHLHSLTTAITEQIEKSGNVTPEQLKTGIDNATERRIYTDTDVQAAFLFTQMKPLQRTAVEALLRATTTTAANTRRAFRIAIQLVRDNPDNASDALEKERMTKQARREQLLSAPEPLLYQDTDLTAPHAGAQFEVIANDTGFSATKHRVRVLGRGTTDGTTRIAHVHLEDEPITDIPYAKLLTLPQPPPSGWHKKIKPDDMVELWWKNGWWPVQVITTLPRGRFKLKSNDPAFKEEPAKKVHHDILRPYPDQSFTNTDNQHAIGIGDTVRIIGCSDHKHNGTEAVIQQWSNTRGRWIVYSVATKHDTPRYHITVLQREYNSSPSPPYDHQRHLRPRQRSSVNGPKTRQQRPRLWPTH